MKSIFALLAAVAVAVGIYVGMGQADPPKNCNDKKADVKPADGETVVQMEDPLPTGSTLRFGTSRFRYRARVKSLSVSPDGKMAFVANDGDMPCVFDLATGRRLFSLNWGASKSARSRRTGERLWPNKASTCVSSMPPP
jgi:hypothetical protein